MDGFRLTFFRLEAIERCALADGRAAIKLPVEAEGIEIRRTTAGAILARIPFQEGGDLYVVNMPIFNTSDLHAYAALLLEQFKAGALVQGYHAVMLPVINEEGCEAQAAAATAMTLKEHRRDLVIFYCFYWVTINDRVIYAGYNGLLEAERHSLWL